MTLLKTPGGSPASAKSSAVFHPLSRVSSAPLKTTVFPASRVAAMGAAERAMGKLKGEMTTQTP